MVPPRPRAGGVLGGDVLLQLLGLDRCPVRPFLSEASVVSFVLLVLLRCWCWRLHVAVPSHRKKPLPVPCRTTLVKPRRQVTGRQIM